VKESSSKCLRISKSVEEEFFELLEVSTLRFEKVWKRVLRVVEEFQHSSV
jgi:hypothetical protein